MTVLIILSAACALALKTIVRANGKQTRNKTPKKDEVEYASLVSVK